MVCSTHPLGIPPSLVSNSRVFWPPWACHFQLPLPSLGTSLTSCWRKDMQSFSGSVPIGSSPVRSKWWAKSKCCLRYLEFQAQPPGRTCWDSHTGSSAYRISTNSFHDFAFEIANWSEDCQLNQNFIVVESIGSRKWYSTGMMLFFLLGSKRKFRVFSERLLKHLHRSARFRLSSRLEFYLLWW